MAYGYDEQEYRPLRGRALEEVKAFLARQGLTWEADVTYTVLLRDSTGRLAATASLQEDVIKCVAVAEDLRGEGLTATVLTAVRREALSRGKRRLFLYTKPENRLQFTSLGFYEVARTDRVLLMEDRKEGFAAWAESLRRNDAAGTIGAVVLNANPMTLGHRYLVEEAARRCDFLYLLVVSEDKSAVPAADRQALVAAATADLAHTAVAGTDRYLVSSATFPAYFLKEKADAGAVWTDLDIAVFLRLAGTLGITRRFVGSEPFCPVTAAYNAAMAEALPRGGVELIELPRMARGDVPVSATAVRQLLKEGRWQEIRPLVPEAVWTYFSREENRKTVLERMGEANPS